MARASSPSVSGSFSKITSSAAKGTSSPSRRTPSGKPRLRSISFHLLPWSLSGFPLNMRRLSGSKRANPSPGNGTGVDGIRSDQPVVGRLFHRVRRPAHHPAAEERGGVQLPGQADGAEDRSEEHTSELHS